MKTNKTLYGILSFLPLILLGLYLVVFFMMFTNILASTGGNQNPPAPMFMDNFFRAFILIFIVIILTLVDLVLFIIHALNNKRVPENERIVWILVFLFAGQVGFPIYWYMRIYKADAENKVEAN